jgi:hypothetical protein
MKRTPALLALALLAAFPPGASAGSEDKPLQFTDENLRPKQAPAPVDAQTAPEPSTPAPQTQPRAGTPPQTRPQTQPVPPTGAPVPQTRPGRGTETRPVGATTPPAGVQTPAPKPGEPDWTQDWKRDQERQAFWEKRIRTAEEGIVRAQERIEYLQRKKASIQNPFAPRVPLSGEDSQAEAGMDGSVRLARVEQQIARARLDLEKAHQDLAGARAAAAEAFARPSPFSSSGETR